MSELLVAMAGIQVLKPVSDVFEIIAGSGMANFWINKTSGRMEEGTNLMWGFPELEDEFAIRVGKVVPDALITFYWPAQTGNEHEVKIEFSEYKGTATVVSITEGSEHNTPEGLAWAIGNTEGWANFCACLKAWAEHGINLRKGAFDYRF